MRDDSGGVDLPALLGPMKQLAPIQIFWRYIAKPGLFQTLTGERRVHVTTTVPLLQEEYDYKNMQATKIPKFFRICAA